ncbi:hypothetical protein ACO0K0_03805 [Undibacterium sp. SXout11W]|uniref:hypothetical protein n=1 Tax=Undibacterium sp. SXout11W TaxID=3413050 RepID=UPI003BF1D93A
MNFFSFFAGVLLFCVSSITCAQNLPPLNSNAWNFIFVQNFESNPETNNLSVQGFNHANLYGQLLSTATAGKLKDIRKIYAFDLQSKASNMKSVESIEPFGILSNLGITRSIVNAGDRTTYNSPSYIISNILANHPHGNYVVSMPVELINSTVSEILNSPTPAPVISNGNYNQYIVLSIENGINSAIVYDDNIVSGKTYPSLKLKGGEACSQAAVKFHADKPIASPFAFNKNQIVHLLRHVEAHPTSTFENGNLVCQGAWRAIGVTEILKRKIGVPAHFFTSNPNNIISCDSTCSYIRPSLTIAPFAIEENKQLELASFQWNDPASLATALFTRNAPYGGRFDQSSVLVGWEHGNIESAVTYLFNTIYNNSAAAKLIPKWNFDDYDTIWTISIDERGGATFSNSCEGVPTESLPSTCPAFMPNAR